MDLSALAGELLAVLMEGRPALSAGEERALVERATQELPESVQLRDGQEELTAEQEAQLRYVLENRLRNLLAQRDMTPKDYRLLRRRLLLKTLERTGSMSRSDDLVQETFEHMILRQDMYRGDASYSTWVFSILFYRAMYQRFRPEISLDELAEQRSSELDPHSLIHQMLVECDDGDGQISNEELLITREKVSKVLEIIPDILKDRYSYQALNLILIQGLSHEEAAESLGITRDHLYKVMSKARKTLQRSVRIKKILGGS